MKRIGESLGSVGTSLLLWLLGIFLPIHGKRILLITTLHLQLVRDGIFREETLEKLNKALRLARYDDALQLPAAVYYKVWDDAKLQGAIKAVISGNIADHGLTYTEAVQLSEAILTVTPEWLHYGRHDDMVKDLISLFYCQATMPGTQNTLAF